jgi:hypothetical protein
LTKRASGSTSDSRHAFKTFAENHPSDPIDVIIGDWMSEANMTVLAGKKADGGGNIDYEPTFLETLQSVLPSIARHGIKVAVNASGSGPKQLHESRFENDRETGLKLNLWAGIRCKPNHWSGALVA